MDLKFRKLGLSGKDKRHHQTELYIAREQPELREQKRSPKGKIKSPHSMIITNPTKKVLSSMSHRKISRSNACITKAKDARGTY